jgi:hypothetical protein
MGLRREKWLRLLLAGTALAWPAAARAQYIDQYFPAAVPGYQDQSGVTVTSRARPDFEPLGIHVGDFLLHANLGESFGYNSNVAGFSNTPGSWLVTTSPSVSINSDWGRNQLSAALSADSTQYLSTPAQNYTNWAATIGGSYLIGEESLVAGYSHLSLHEAPNSIGSPLSTTPIPYTVDDGRIYYTFDAGRFSFIPRIDVQFYQYGNAMLLNVPVSQTYDNRIVSTGGLETRYNLTDQHRIVFVVQGINAQYTDIPAGQPTSNSQSVLALGGIDYQATGPWRYRVLVGVERRAFTAQQFPTHTGPVAEASVIWTPTGLTTVTGVLSHTIEDAQQPGTAGYTYTRANLEVDHEYLRNVLLQASAGYQAADYIQTGQTQTSYTLGTGAQWLINRRMRLGLTYAFTQQTGLSNTTYTLQQQKLNGVIYGNYTQSIVLLTLKLGL